ncbi:hypothetical protein [Pseudooceanicola aestuarii]|uniref:hypothetical protein n=1 Tax=Pseudooceanicola aestuarii TaxID=2697319 RepID=UPI0013D1E03B|nr:hypothetical protein [Pseudooceanicola aestuarii]
MKITGKIGLPSQEIASFGKTSGKKASGTHLAFKGKIKGPRKVTPQPPARPVPLANLRSAMATARRSLVPLPAPPLPPARAAAPLTATPPAPQQGAANAARPAAQPAAQPAATPARLEARTAALTLAQLAQDEFGRHVLDVHEAANALAEGRAHAGRHGTDLVALQLDLSRGIEDKITLLSEAASGLPPHAETTEALRALTRQAILVERPGLVLASDAALEALSDALLDLKAGSGVTGDALTGDLVRALTRSEAFCQLASPGSKTAATADEQTAILTQMTRALAQGNSAISGKQLLHAPHGDVGRVMTALTVGHLRDMAASQFIAAADGDAFDAARGLYDEGARPSVADLRAALPAAARADFDTSQAVAGEIADLRVAFDTQQSRVVRLLGPKQAHLAQAALLIAAGGLRDTREDDTGRMDIRRLKFDDNDAQGARVAGLLDKLGRDNKPAAFQLARLAHMLSALADAERGILGVDRFGLGPDAKFDAAAVLRATGLTEQDMSKLYGDRDLGTDVHLHMERLGNSGFKGVKDLKRHIDRTSGAGEVLRNRGVQKGLQDRTHSSLSATGALQIKRTLEDAAQFFETADARTRAADADGPDLPRDAGDQARLFMGTVARAIQSTCLDGPDGQATRDSFASHAATVAEAVEAEVGALSDLAELEAEVATAKRLLNDLSAGDDGPLSGTKINAKHPRGLHSAKAVLTALAAMDALAEAEAARDTELDELRAMGMSDATLEGAATTMDANMQPARQAMTDALETIRGLDLTKMHRSWTDRFSRAAARQALPDPATLRDARAAAEAIVLIREGAAQRRAGLEDAVTAAGLAREQAHEDRRADAPELFRVMDRMIRTAVMSHLPNEGGGTADGRGGITTDADMSTPDRRAAIERTLTGWGVDIAVFAPEIDRATADPISLGTLKSWQADLRTDRFADLLGLDIPAAAATGPSEAVRNLGENFLLFIANKRVIDSQAREELEALFSHMENGSKFDLKSGTEIKLSSGKIPLDPSGMLTLQGRLKGSILKNLGIEMSSKGQFKITGALGGGVGAGVDFDATALKLTADAGVAKAQLKVGAGVSVDGSYEGFAGFETTYPATEAGRQAAMTLILDLIDRQRPSAELFEDLDAAARMQSHQGKGSIGAKAGASASILAQPGGNDNDSLFEADSSDDTDFKSGASNTHGATLGVSVGVAAGIGGKVKTSTTLDSRTVQTEFTKEAKVYAKASASVSTFSAFGLAGNAAATQSGLQAAADQEFDIDTDPDKVRGGWSGGTATTSYELASLGAEISISTTRKIKTQFALEGAAGTERLTKAEFVETATVGSVPFGRIVDLMVSEPTLAKLRAPGNEERFNAAHSILKEGVRRGDGYLEMSYAMKPEKLTEARRLMELAQELRNTGHRTRSRRVQGKVNDMMRTRDNYEATKLSFRAKTEVKDVANRGKSAVMALNVIGSMKHDVNVLSVSL